MQSDTVATPEGWAAIPPGTMLRHAREARGESLDEVAQALKLSLRQLDALESGHHEALPGPAFVRGFLRNYARHVGLDPAAVLAALGSDTTTAVDLTPLSNAAGDMPVGGGVRFNLLPAAVVAGLLLVLTFAGSYFGWFETTENPTPAVVEPLAEEPASVDPGTAMPPPAADEPSVSMPQAVAEIEQSATPPASAIEPSAPSLEVLPDPTASTEPPAPLVAEPADTADALRFTFAAESWVEVRDGTGAILFAGTGAAGSTRAVQGEPPFALVVGNARSVRLDYRGKPIDLMPHTKASVARLTVQ